MNGGFFLFLKVGEGLDELSMDDVVGNATIAAYKSAIAIRCCIKCNSFDPYRSFFLKGVKSVVQTTTYT
ncbi:hypothetical protein [Paenibacillus sp. Root444D2]|uniref:hypothetical protein n=1 Tax=Paenibacillus sp. Root444D2 TaxID=1736538 RepID=UPI00070EC4C3|nr:hypothetical protein [Paenibacillus sp. Root444D2]KQX66963.1 hypothetical protein ASD40_27830 [Paenibacillus sp. Root444D2]